MSPATITLLSASLALAAVAALFGWAAARERRDGDPWPAPADQGPAGGHLGWFEARWVRVLRPDVLFAVVVTRERLLLLRVGGQWSGPHAHSNKVPKVEVFKAESARRARYSAELAALSSPGLLLGRHARDFEIPLSAIRAVLLRPRTGWARAGWKGPAELVVQRAGAPALRWVLEDAWQLAACAGALEAVLGGALRPDPSLRAPIREPDGDVRRAVIRSEAIGGIAIGTLCAVVALTLGAIALIQTARLPLEKGVARVISCKTTSIPRRSPSLRMELDAPPATIEFDPHRGDWPGLRSACQTQATVELVYRPSRVTGPAQGVAIRRLDGDTIISEEEGARRERSANVAAAVVGGIAAGLAAGLILVSTLRARRRIRDARGPR